MMEKVPQCGVRLCDAIKGAGLDTERDNILALCSSRGMSFNTGDFSRRITVRR